MNRPGQFPHPMLFALCGVCVLFASLGVVSVDAATYYVATTGSDSNPGTSSSPWRNPQKCAASPVKAGDTCIVRSGTYTVPSGKTYVVNIGTASASGTSSQPITIKSEKSLGASIIIPSTSSTNNGGFYVAKPYYVIEGFNISGGANNGSTVGFIGVKAMSTATGLIVRANSIHHIARAVCSNSVYGFDGIYMARPSGVLIERNRIYTIGRRRNGESGCSTNKFMADHGIYVDGATNLTIRRNVFYDVTRGFPINMKSSTTGIKIYHNTLSGASPTGLPTGQVAITDTASDVQFRNNIFHNPPQGYVFWWNTNSRVSSLVITYNLSNSTKTNLINPYLKPSSGITYTSNFSNLNPAHINAGAGDFRLTSSSPAINRGTTSGVPLVASAPPDIGSYEYAVQSNLSSPLTPTGVVSQ